MDQHDHAPDALGAQLRDQRVHGVGLVGEIQPGHTRGRDDGRRAFQRHADECDLVAQEVLHPVGRKEGPAAGGLGHVGGQEAEAGAGEAAIPQVGRQTLARVDVGGMVAALLHAQQFVLALVEFMVPDGVEVDADAVHGLDRGLVLEQRRGQRAGADHVAGRDHRMQRVGGLELLDAGGKARHARIAGGAFTAFDIAVEVVEGDELDLQRAADARLARRDQQPRPFNGAELAAALHGQRDAAHVRQESGLVAPGRLVADAVVHRHAVGAEAVGHLGRQLAHRHRAGHAARGAAFGPGGPGGQQRHQGDGCDTGRRWRSQAVVSHGGKTSGMAEWV